MSNEPELDFYEWLKYGYNKGWCGVPVCYTHDGVPVSEAEDDEQINGLDPCIHVIRMYSDDEERQAVESWFAAYQHRRPGFLDVDDEKSE